MVRAVGAQIGKAGRLDEHAAALLPEVRGWLAEVESSRCGGLRTLRVRRGGRTLVLTARTEEAAAPPAAAGRDSGALWARDRTRSAVDGLTARQREIARWVAEGKTNPEIGIILGISARTVQKHLEHIFLRLNVPTRTALAAEVLGGGR